MVHSLISLDMELKWMVCGGQQQNTTFKHRKSEDATYQQKIRNARSPKEAASLGRSRELPIRADWELVKDEVMYRAVLKKFQTHKDLRELLLSTGIEEIVENAPGDYYWGCGLDGTGLNKLGKILQRVRADLSG